MADWAFAFADALTIFKLKRYRDAEHRVRWIEAYGGSLYKYDNTLEAIEIEDHVMHEVKETVRPDDHRRRQHERSPGERRPRGQCSACRMPTA